MRYGSICSGMEAASLAWRPLGWEAAFVAEIEKAPVALLKVRFSDVPNLGDVTTFENWPDAAIDVLVGGTPCQSFSIAGLRKGLADPRGSLMLVFGAIAARYRPAWLVWENVPGVLSDDEGRSFASLLGLLSGQDIEPPKDGWQNSGIIAGDPNAYGLAWRVLDAQYFGLAQRRARVFVIGHLGNWRASAAVLFEPESLRGDSPPRREARERVAGTITGGARRSGYSHDDIPAVSFALNAHGGSCGRQDAESETLIAHALRGEGFDASEDGTGRGTPIIAFDTTQVTSSTNRSNPLPGDPCHPVTAHGHAPAIAFSSKDHGADATDDLAPTMRAMGHDGSHANAGGQLAVAFNITPSNSNKDYNARQSERAQAVTTQSGAPSARGGDVVVEPYTLAIRGRGETHNLEYRQDGVANALLTPNGGRAGIGVGAIAEQWAVRRLTERECERLQGAPDDHTLIPFRGKPIAGGPRYKMIGNSFAVNVVRWIGERIDLVNRALLTQEQP